MTFLAILDSSRVLVCALTYFAFYKCALRGQSTELATSPNPDIIVVPAYTDILDGISVNYSLFCPLFGVCDMHNTLIKSLASKLHFLLELSPYSCSAVYIMHNLALHHITSSISESHLT